MCGALRCSVCQGWVFAERLSEKESCVNIQWERILCSHPAFHSFGLRQAKGTPLLVLSYKQIDLKNFLARILKSHLSQKSYLWILCSTVQFSGRSLCSHSWVFSSSSCQCRIKCRQDILQPVEQQPADVLFLLPSQTPPALLSEEEQGWCLHPIPVLQAPHSLGE